MLACGKQPSEDGYSVVTKGWTWSTAHLVLSGSKCEKKISSRSLNHHLHSEPVIQNNMDPCLMLIPSSEMLQEKPRLRTNQATSNFVEHGQILASVSCS